ncbi:Roy1p KNAG_0J00450 [Huiozyma naganishii CBS 8797]|uniref:F-box domain-containing protein n=1 Tax=Huiozyma naganishii (strain ATCC MYA-139 / BCRC 22969 / CBS 8797 / KCTC 17520 / NBRC 10181 / NCYC 3082 / Yp74L-3) TaxID=1071383 RepID=J7RQP8_HUIN7|nr:hypothetical protein KNAG_0J00450 [Kazachstania naganishii CBS 8797]CCK72128.1 hypothetical protein KNAG_0J00450 [Kazachstania naganishii CBS 8797]
MSGERLLSVLNHVGFFLNQNDMVNLSLVSRKFHNSFAIDQLYAKLRITEHPILRAERSYLDCGITYLSGYRSAIKSHNQNDMFLYDKIELLLESGHIGKIKEFIIEENVFHDVKEGRILLGKLVARIIDIGDVERLELRDNELLRVFYEKILQLQHLKHIDIFDFNLLGSITAMHNVSELKLVANEAPIPCNGSLFGDDLLAALETKIEQLIISVNDYAFSTYRLFQFLESESVKFSKLTALKLDLVHAPFDFSHDAHEMIVNYMSKYMQLEKLSNLEITFCCPFEDCTCHEDFLLDLAPHLKSLKQLGLIEKALMNKGHHYAVEDWDLAMCNFLLNIPNVGEKLKVLALKHDPPLNGIAEDTVDGNYKRRRKLFDNVLPRLYSLEKLIIPRMLQSISPYEILVCDLLWNGCTCDFCKTYLPVFDQYLMNHQYYPEDKGRFTDMIPPVFLGYVGEILARRTDTNRVEWELDTLRLAPENQLWDFHGFENIQHFQEYECHFNENFFPMLATCISHFFNGYMYHIVQYLPKLRLALLSGVYYSVDSMDNPIPETFYEPNHETFFTTIVDTSTSDALKCPTRFESLYD